MGEIRWYIFLLLIFTQINLFQIAKRKEFNKNKRFEKNYFWNKILLCVKILLFLFNVVFLIMNFCYKMFGWMLKLNYISICYNTYISIEIVFLYTIF